MGYLPIGSFSGDAQMPRFVILLHELPPGQQRSTHWDLMLEWGAALRTWALPCGPAPGMTVDAEALADHRLAYLEYEGPVATGRGSVSRWDEGQYTVESNAPDALTIALAGRRLSARLTLKKSDESHFWRVSVWAAPTRG